ncbi:unnamed protein product [Prunus armeniaca]
MEITPPVADMRYFSFLDKSKQDIESSGLVLGRSFFISSKPLLGFHKLGSTLGVACVQSISIESNDQLSLRFQFERKERRNLIGKNYKACHSLPLH